ncbi:hypothetical protein FHX82_006664 [Amycolatopsis bartoniae]|uniref:Uncharacterized protein n=1 Tax=Amycolatopsis bartoniae TaxID=941986 RepID=A0A8H9IUA5_9PSEU|nr:hypothetical protein [Amycolatopsis bartoniae]MBB2939578.1 hypothetical protein [Amycolatopsis bartoniae]TVT07789.1 hypothetical protein FNH07_14760 [Amycolatopsis bartoniae]GHF39345.1 hypothetical protein GCM10017566_10800 [Amycolatopsis bartoniae]
MVLLEGLADGALPRDRHLAAAATGRLWHGRREWHLLGPAAAPPTHRVRRRTTVAARTAPAPVPCC